MSDFSADFEQITIDELNRKGVDTGHLYLKRDRMMRWEYNDRRGDKLFVSDGKTVYFYVAADKMVRRAPVKEAFDERMPLMFLLGRSNLRDEFTQFRELREKPLVPGDRVISMEPKRKGELEEVKIEVDPVGYRIRRLSLRRSDGTGMEFTFNNIDDKTKREPRFFEFRVPPGVEVVDGI
ncbi:MAG TPA: outer membrane lipoprotein carrier protein LolA [Terriglobia bacterium]|nr:outer membrane lipoprotein carrier protein LolA [Terriglobia bacterium]